MSSNDLPDGRNPAPEQPAPDLVLRFTGSGWMLPFHCGVAKFIQQHLDASHQRLRFAGQSTGSLLAAALATGTDLDTVYEDVLELYKHCKHKPFRAPTFIKEAIRRLAPQADATWVRCNKRLAVGLAQRHWWAGGGGWGWRSGYVTEFRGRDHGVQVLLAACHVPMFLALRGEPVDGKRYFSGALAERVSNVPPEQLGLNANAFGGPADPAFAIDICCGGGPCGTAHIRPGFPVPPSWFSRPLNPHISHKLFELGFLRAAECLSKVDPAVLAGLWRPGAEPLTTDILQDVVDQIDEALDDLARLDKGGCCGALFSLLKRTHRAGGPGGAPGPGPQRAEHFSELWIRQLPVPRTSEALRNVTLASPAHLNLPDKPVAVVAYEKAKQLLRHKRAASAAARRASLQLGPITADPKRISMQLRYPPGGDPSLKSLQLGYPVSDPRRASLQLGLPVNYSRRGSLQMGGYPPSGTPQLAKQKTPPQLASQPAMTTQAEQRRAPMQSCWSPVPSQQPSRPPVPASKRPSGACAGAPTPAGGVSSSKLASKPASPPQLASPPPQLSSPHAAAAATAAAGAAIIASEDWSYGDAELSSDVGDDAAVMYVASECPTAAASGVLCLPPLERAGTTASGGITPGGSTTGLVILEDGIRKRRSSGLNNKKVLPLPAALPQSPRAQSPAWVASTVTPFAAPPSAR